MNCTPLNSLSNSQPSKSRFMVEGARPDATTINEWLKKDPYILITYMMRDLVTNRPVEETFKGHIRNFDEYNSVVWLRGVKMGVFLNAITHFKAEVFIATPSETKENILLICGHENGFIVNHEKLKNKFSFFKSQDLCGLKKIDLSSKLTVYQLTIVERYVNELIKIDSFLNPDEALALFGAALIFDEKPILEELTAKFSFLESIFNIPKTKSTNLHLLCRSSEVKNKTIETKSYLGSLGVNIAFNLARDRGTIKELTILNVNDQDINIIFNNLTNDKNLERLNISWLGQKIVGDGLSDDKAKLIALLIQTLPALKELKICAHRFTNKALEDIKLALEHNPSLTKLDLSANKFTTSAIEDFKKNSSFKNLEIIA